MSGYWDALIDNWPIRATHMVHLRTGKLLIWNGGSVTSGTPARLWDLDAPTTFPSVNAPAPLDMFCAGHSALPDGRILVSGGAFLSNINKSVFHNAVFNPANSTWAEAEPLVFRRWYPTCTTMADGRIAIFAGWSQFAPALSPENAEVYDGAEATCTASLDALRPLDNYPFTFMMPGGSIYHAGPQQLTAFLNLTSWTWDSNIDSGMEWIQHQSAAMFDAVAGKILKCGGAPQPTFENRAVVDTRVFNGSSWGAAGNLNLARVNHNLVCLPNGKVLAVGGSEFISPVDDTRVPAMRAEVFDPGTGLWTIDSTSAVMARPRGYHSTAMLLRDARVLVAGGDDMEEQNLENGQIYNPPYLAGTPARATITVPEESMAYDTNRKKNSGADWRGLKAVAG